MLPNGCPECDSSKIIVDIETSQDGMSGIMTVTCLSVACGQKTEFKLYPTEIRALSEAGEIDEIEPTVEYMEVIPQHNRKEIDAVYEFLSWILGF